MEEHMVVVQWGVSGGAHGSLFEAAEVQYSL